MKSKEFLKVKRTCKTFHKKNKDKIVDVIIFGSKVKGATHPKDIDIALITKTGKKESIQLAEKLERKINNPQMHITYNIIDNLFLKPEPIWLSILHEGVSLITGDKISDKLFLEPKVLFKYDSSKLEYKDKIRFYYALKGRDGKSGIIKKTKTEYLSKTILLVETKFDKEIQEFLKHWKLPFSRRVIFMEK